jgi:transposase
MQGIKEYQEKFFVSFRLSEHVPQDNFYRRLKERLDLSYLHTLTKKYYGTEGQKSIDTEVFFKLMLIGYLENINSDRQIISQAQMRLDMLYFLGYDLDEPLPWHSTLSRTRQLFGEDVFLEAFRNILRMCVVKGMVSGKTQAIDSAFIKANASMDSLVEKELNRQSKKYYDEITENEEDKTVKKRKHSDHFVSATDPDSRVSQKRGKSPALNYLGIISVDTENHVICAAAADFADKRDSETTENIVRQTIDNLGDNNLSVEEVLADTNYSSGETYQFLEDTNITAYIPPHGQYHAEKEGFTYNEDGDFYSCSQGTKLPFKRIRQEHNRQTFSKEYRTTTADCKHCPQKEKCCKKMNYKSLKHSIDKPYYDKAYLLMNTQKGKRKMRLRAATVEPVWGTLLHFRKLKKVYTLGQDLANKQILMAAAAYNLKKLIYFKMLKNTANELKNSVMSLKSVILNDILTGTELVWVFLQSKTCKIQNLMNY